MLLYLIDNQGLIALEYFKKRIPAQLKDKIKKYVEQNQKSIKKDYEVIANYFYDKNSNEYIIKGPPSLWELILIFTPHRNILFLYF